MCNPSPETLRRKNTPRRRERATIHGSGAEITLNRVGKKYVLIKTKKGHATFSLLGKDTEVVHLDGLPFKWALEEVVRRCPKLQFVRIIPSSEKYLRETHRAILREKNIQLITGHHSPHMAWGENENRSPHYRAQKKFMHNLQGEQRDLFTELLNLEFEDAMMASRFFCLNDEAFIPQWDVGIEYGISTTRPSEVSFRINAILHYLDPSFTVGIRSQQRVRAYHDLVKRVRVLVEKSMLKTELINAINRAKEQRKERGYKRNTFMIPENMPFSQLGVYEKLIQKWAEGLLDVLEIHNVRLHDVLCVRYGIYGGKYSTLSEVAQTLMHRRNGIVGLSRERARQLIDGALTFIGISDDV